MTSAAGQIVRGRSAALRANMPLFMTLAVYANLAFAAANYWNLPIDLQLYSQPFLLFGSGVAVILFAAISIRLMLDRPRRLAPALKDVLLVNELPYRVTVGLPVMLVLPLFFSLFTSIKGGINRIVPYYADPAIIALDRKIHGGVDAWRVYEALAGSEGITFLLNLLYNFWFVLMFVVLFCVTFMAGNERLRSQYLVAFVLTWALLGNLAAVMFASVGPAFVAPFYGDAAFAPLLDHLRGVGAVYPIWAIETQQMLLTDITVGGPTMGGGISAFPSLHVAVATLNAIYLWRFGGLLRWAGVIFLAAIQLGSVCLAWHYGVDGYVSMLATPFIWLASGAVTKVTLR